MSRLSQALADGAARRGDQPAVICADGRLSYAALGREIPALAAALQRYAPGEGRHIGLALGNSRTFVEVLLGALRLGVAVVPLDPEEPAASLARTLDRGDAPLAVVPAERARELGAAAAPNCPAQTPVLVDRDAGTAVPLAELPAGAPAALPDPSAIAEASPFILTATSGSTGSPKPIVLGQDTKYARAQAAIASYGVTERDVVLAATPLYHSLALRHIFVALAAGATAVIAERFTPASWLDLVESYGATFAIPVSAQLRQLLPHFESAAGKRQSASLRCVVASSAPLPDEAKDRLLAATDFAFHECYGTSELGIATDLNVRAQPERRHSVGRPVTGVTVAIAAEDGRALPAGAVGEICCRSALQCHGYYKDPEAERAAFCSGYFYTGDLGYLEPDGYLVYRGRTKFVINTGGAQVVPEDVDEAVARVPGVADCAAFALPHPELGEEVAVAVVPSAEAGALARAVRRHCVAHLAPRQQPRRIFLLDSLPRNALGKLQRAQLPAWVVAAPNS